MERLAACKKQVSSAQKTINGKTIKDQAVLPACLGVKLNDFKNFKLKIPATYRLNKLKLKIPATYRSKINPLQRPS